MKGIKTDFFSEVAWNDDAEKVMIWAPQLSFKNRSQPFYKIGSNIFLNIKGGGVLFCKGCAWSSEFKNSSLLNLFLTTAHADVCSVTPHQNLRDINLVVKREVNSRSVFDSLKTCKWSMPDLIKKTYSEVKQTMTDVADGSLFRDLLGMITGLDAALSQFRDNIVPMLSQMRDQLREVFDHFVCEFSQQNLRTVAIGLIVPGGGSVGAFAKVAVNVKRLQRNLEIWTKNTASFKVLIGLKQKHNGKIPTTLLAAMGDIRHDLPVTPKGFGNSASLRRHFTDHSELGFKNAADYEKAAIRFSGNKSPSAMVLESKAKNNWVKFDPATKEYAVMNRQGEMITYFKKDRFNSEEAFEHFLQNHTTVYK